MPYLMLLGVILLSLAIAVAIIGREGQRQSDFGPIAVFDIEEAVAWIGDHLPQEIQGELSYDEVRKVIYWNIEFMKSRGVIANGHKPNPREDVVVGGAEAVEYVVNRARAEDMELRPEAVHAVLDAQVGYLAFIGAVGTEANSETESN